MRKLSIVLLVLRMAVVMFVPIAKLYAQTDSAGLHTVGSWVERLDVQSRVLPQEYVFVHMDNTCYFKGDTVFYAAYVNRSDNGKPSDMSGVLYAELLDNDGYLVERQILRLKDGKASGSFCLNDTLYGGYYELRAYTRWQLNWGVYEHEHSKRTIDWFFNRECEEQYFRDYDKLYSRVFPVYDKPDEEGCFPRDMSLRPLRRYFKTREEKPVADVAFFPEGGSWVEGVEQRIAFEANTPNGEHLDGTLFVYDKANAIVAEAAVEHRGRGILTITGRRTQRYRAVFRWGGSEQEVKLPEMNEDGVVLKCEQKDETLQLNVESVGRATDETLGYVVLHNGILQVHGIVDSDLLSVPLCQLPTGVAQIVVFGSSGRVWADRLVFVRHDFRGVNTLILDGMKNVYEPYEKIQLRLTSQNASEGTVSVSVKDAALSGVSNDSGTMLTEMLLCSQIKGFVEQPEYYFESDDKEHRHRLDLLLMVQGWRRHQWHQLTRPVTLCHRVERQRYLTGNVWNMVMPYKERFDPTGLDHPHWSGAALLTHRSAISNDGNDVGQGVYEKSQNSESGPISITGETQHFNYDPYYKHENEMAHSRATSASYDQHGLKSKEMLKNEVLVHADFSKIGSEGVVGDVVTEKGRFTMTLPDFDGLAFMHLAASDTVKWSKRFRKNDKKPNVDTYPWVVRDDEFNTKNVPEFYVRLYFPYPRFVKAYSYYQTAELSSQDDAFEDGTYQKDSLTIMKEFVVKQKRTGLRRFNRTAPAFKLDAYDAFNAVVDAGLHAPLLYSDKAFDMAVASNYIGEMGVKYRSYNLEQRWDYYDSSHFLDPVSHFHYRQMCYLDSVYVYTDYSPRKEGDKRYDQAFQPTVTIDLHLLPNDDARLAYLNRFYLLPGYSVCEEFYHPDYSSRLLGDAPKDYRRTLYWNPCLPISPNGDSTITFWNNSRRNQLSIEVEGISNEGDILSFKNN